MKSTWSATAAALLALAACGGDDPSPGEEATTTTADRAGSEDATTSTTAEETTTTTAAAAAECDNELAIAGSDVADGPVEVAMAISDAGPHPANTVDYDASLELAIASFEIEADPQFGLTIPVGIPDVPDGEVILLARLALDDSDGVIEAGHRFVDSTTDEEADGTVSNIGLFAASERIGPLVDVVIEVTAIDDEQVCGTIETVGGTDLQTFPTIVGSFRADRLQFLESQE